MPRDEADLTRRHPRNPSKQSQINRIRTRLDNIGPLYHDETARVVAILRAIVDLLEDEL